MNLASSKAYGEWLTAKKAADFSLYRDSMATLIDFTRRSIDLRDEKKPTYYDALLDDYEKGNDHVQLAPAHFFEQRAESKGLDRAGTAHGLAQRLSDLRVESGLRALGGKGEGRIIVFHADAEDFLGSAAGREPREQQREEEPSQKNGPE